MAPSRSGRRGRALGPSVVVDPKAPELSPAHVISHYSGDQWEEFVDELVEGIQSTRGYVLAKRMGGPGDLGIDVAGFKTVNGLEGPWDWPRSLRSDR